MENVHLTKFTKNVNNIQALSDRPNTADGLTPQGLKEKFDKAGSDIKSYINDDLILEVESYLKKCLESNDERLINSRRCNNTFDDVDVARQNLKIKSGTSLPETVEEGCLFFLYS